MMFCTYVTQIYSTCAAKSIYDISKLILAKPIEMLQTKLENSWDFYMYIYLYRYVIQ